MTHLEDGADALLFFNDRTIGRSTYYARWRPGIKLLQRPARAEQSNTVSRLFGTYEVKVMPCQHLILGHHMTSCLFALLDWITP